MSADRKPILVLDFDGVLHSYTSRWTKASEVNDAATPGAAVALEAYLQAFDVQVFSSRSHQDGGLTAMQQWTVKEFGYELASQLGWPLIKPPALVTLDDRAITFDGSWPSVAQLRAFRPWNKR